MQVHSRAGCLVLYLKKSMTEFVIRNTFTFLSECCLTTEIFLVLVYKINKPLQQNTQIHSGITSKVEKLSGNITKEFICPEIEEKESYISLTFDV